MTSRSRTLDRIGDREDDDDKADIDDFDDDPPDENTYRVARLPTSARP
jgi:hypothetical protein